MVTLLLTRTAHCRLVFPVGLSANAVTATIACQEAKTGPHALLPPTPWDPQQLLSRLLMGRAPTKHLLARLLSGEQQSIRLQYSVFLADLPCLLSGAECLALFQCPYYA